jgi:phage gp45-like
MTGMREFASKIRNLFSTGELQKRYDDDGRARVMTHTERVLEKPEAFPYGFYAKAKRGRVLVFCQGGNYNDYEILPVLKAGDVPAPELREGDAALYTGEGGCVIVREAGGVEVYAKGEGDVSLYTEEGGCVIVRGDGGVEVRAKGGGNIRIVSEDGALFFANGKTNTCKILLDLIDEIKGLITTGSSVLQKINAVSQQKLEAYKNKIKELYAEAE